MHSLNVRQDYPSFLNFIELEKLAPFIGSESDLFIALSLTHARLVNLIDATLACEDANSKLVEVVTVADVDDEDRVGNSLLQIWKLRFGHKAKLLFRLWAQDLVKILKLAADVWLGLRSWILVKILKLGLAKILSLSLVEILMFGWDMEVNA